MLLSLKTEEALRLLAAVSPVYLLYLFILAMHQRSTWHGGLKRELS